MGGEPNASRGVCGVSDEPEPPLCCRAELRVLLSSAAPLSLFGFVQFAMSAVSIAFVGRLGSQALAAAALGGSFANVVGVSLLFGFTLPLDTICSQAFGAGRFRSLGVAVQRTLCVNLALCVLVSLVWAHADALFLVMGQDAELAALAGRYTRTLIPHAWLASGQFPLQKALQAQGVMAPFAAVGVVLLGFHIGVTDYMACLIWGGGR